MDLINIKIEAKKLGYKLVPIPNYDCACNNPYPNIMCKYKNGNWKCVDKYENVEDWKPKRHNVLTHCRKREGV